MPDVFRCALPHVISACPADTYQPLSTAAIASCLPCPASSATVPGALAAPDISFCQCQAGFYFSTAARACVIVPQARKSRARLQESLQIPLCSISADPNGTRHPPSGSTDDLSPKPVTCAAGFLHGDAGADFVHALPRGDRELLSGRHSLQRVPEGLRGAQLDAVPLPRRLQRQHLQRVARGVRALRRRLLPRRRGRGVPPLPGERRLPRGVAVPRSVHLPGRVLQG